MVGTWRDTGEGLDLFSGEFFTAPAVSLVTSGSLPAMLPALEETRRSQGQSDHSQAWWSSEQRSSTQVTAGQVALGLAFPWVAQVLLLPGKPPGCLYCPSCSPRNSHLLELPPPPAAPPGLSLSSAVGDRLPRLLLASLSSSPTLKAGLLQGREPVPGLGFHREGAPQPHAQEKAAHMCRPQGPGLGPLPTPQARCASQAVCIHRPHWRSAGCLVGSAKVEGVLPVGGEFGEGK